MATECPELLDAIRRGVVKVEKSGGVYTIGGATGDMLIQRELERLGAVFDAGAGTWSVAAHTVAAGAAGVAGAKSLEAAYAESRKVAAVLAVRADRAAKDGARMTDRARNRLQKRASREIREVYEQAIKEHQGELKRVAERYNAAQDPVEAIKLGYRRKELDAVIKSLSDGLSTAGSDAASAVDGLLPETRKVARNIAAWQVDNMSGVNVSRMLGNRSAALASISKYGKVKYREKDVSPAFIARMEAANKYDKRAWAHIGNRQRAEKALRKAVMRGILTGEHPSKVAKRIGGVFDQWKGRAMVIARTETARVMNAAQQELYAELNAGGVKIRNRWDATLDSRTRDSHRKVDGEIREVGEKFSNGCLRPGDGGAAECINCRCVLAPVVDGFEPDAPMRRDNESGKLAPYTTYEQWAETHDVG